MTRALLRRLLGDSIRVRLALWHTLTVAALLGTFAVGTRIFLVRTIGARADQALADMARGFVDVWNSMRAEDEASAGGAAAAAASEFRERDRRIVVFDSAGRLIAMSDTTARWPALSRHALSDLRDGPVAALLQHATPRSLLFATLDPGREHRASVRALAMRVAVGGQPFTVLALRSLHAE